LTPTLNQTVGEIAAGNPSAIRVFESLGIDYCCGGGRTLQDACDQAHVAPSEAIDRLSTPGEPASGAKNWTEASARELIEHIAARHHAYVRAETPRLLAMLEKVVKVHCEIHPELISMQDLFGALARELAAHMMKEENVLFPYIEGMERAVADGAAPPPALFGRVEKPISRMIADHEDAGALLARMRTLSGSYVPPESACAAYRGLYLLLEEFERDLHLHIHLENNILFPLALRLEQGLAEAAHERR
jgi:regulator of cell morphogenesis and NO signaling